MAPITLDRRDQMLLSLLTRNARLPVSELARELNLSPTAVRHRIEKLERNGCIKGYTLKTAEFDTSGVQAVATVTLKSGTVADLKKDIQHLVAVKKIWSLAGNLDAFVLLQAETIEELYKTINTIGTSRSVKRLTSHVVLEQLLD